MAELEPRRIIAMGGGGFWSEPSQLDRFVLSQARRAHPRVCFIPTASGDSETYITAFYRSYSALDCRLSDLPLFERTAADLAQFVLAQDVIYVGGGNTASMLAVWRVHGLDRLLRRAWEQGIVMCGLSAGMNCWFEQSVTDSFGAHRLAALDDGLGLLSGSCCPHYDGEALRRGAYEHFVGAGELRDGYAADDGVALVFRGTELHEVVSAERGAAAYRIERTGSGVSERRLEPRYLGSASPSQ
jgi:peptidase E